MPTTTPPTPVTKLGFDPGYLPVFEDKLFIEGVQTARRLTNFFVLLLLATVIATYGILSGSTATVIGAMIVAPLMGPIMATTAAVVMGSTQRALPRFWPHNRWHLDRDCHRISSILGRSRYYNLLHK